MPLIAGIIALTWLAGIRVLARTWHERRVRDPVTAADGSPSRVLIVGAGDAGRVMAQEIRRHPRTGMVAVGFLDDSLSKAGLTISGLKVLGRVDDLPEVVEIQRRRRGADRDPVGHGRPHATRARHGDRSQVSPAGSSRA